MKTKPSIERRIWREHQRKEKEKLKILEKEYCEIQREVIIYNKRNGAITRSYV